MEAKSMKTRAGWKCNRKCCRSGHVLAKQYKASSLRVAPMPGQSNSEPAQVSVCDWMVFTVPVAYSIQ